MAALARRTVRMGRNNGDSNRPRGLEQIDHLLVGERGDRVAADLDEPAALAQAGLPGVAEVLHLGDEAVVLHVEPELPKLVPPRKKKGQPFSFSIFIFVTFKFCFPGTLPASVGDPWHFGANSDPDSRIRTSD